MFFPDRVRRVYGSAAVAAFSVLILLSALSLAAQQSAPQEAKIAQLPHAEPTAIALPLGEDRGAAALEQSLKRLSTTASLMMIVAHPDDEDGALLTYLSRGLGVRCTLLTLTRGEGGQNAMSADSYDALGLIRTNELLKAGEFYGVKQLWGTEVDFGFSKTQEEAFAKWSHDRVLYDAVLAVRRERPQIIVSTFVGGITDGHGHHQVSGEVAQEVFKAAADPTVFPEQLKDGLQPWQPLAVYSMVPFARVTDGKMFDYATGKWAPAKFKNYVTGEWSTEIPSTDVSIPVGTLDAALGRSYLQIAREGWGEQKSQNGGGNPILSGPANTNYHLWARADLVEVEPNVKFMGSDLFHNQKVAIDTTLLGLLKLAGPQPPLWLANGLRLIDTGLEQIKSVECQGTTSVVPHVRQNVFGALAPDGCSPLAQANKLARVYRQTLDLRAKIAAGNLAPVSKASVLFELDAKIEQFQSALKNLLGLDLIAFTTKAASVSSGPFPGGSADETPRTVTPGEQFMVRVHTARATTDARLSRVWLESATGDEWKSENTSSAIDPTDHPALATDQIFKVQASPNAEPTQPYFTRPTTEQPYYDLPHPEYRERSFAPWPIAAWAEFSFDGVPIRLGQVVQTMHRVVGPGGIYEPLVVTPAIGVRIEPEARILPLDGSPLPVKVTVHAEGPAEGTIKLKLLAGWTLQPPEAHFHLDSAGDTEPILFSVTPVATRAGAYTIQAEAHSGGHSYESGWQGIGYSGLSPYNLYKPAQLKTGKVDVKIAPGLRIGYIMGPGDLVPEAIEALGITPHLLSTAEVVSGDFSTWNVLVVGIRAYSTRPELTAAQPRLNEFVRRGGTLVVQYQTGNFPAPFPLSMGRTAERVVDEQAPVKLLDSANPLLASPNAITTADFDGWIEERGHSFLDTWDPAYTALTETADPGQDPQRGGLLIAHAGKGTYIYVAYALYRQLPELVPGAYRILANLLSASQTQPPRP
jgi:LmbE family N-acetylglucosaminyl deacetylase